MILSIPLSPEKLAVIKARLLTSGIVVAGDQGVLEYRGVVLKYMYAAGYLTLELVKKPMLVSEAYVEGKLREWFDA